MRSTASLGETLARTNLSFHRSQFTGSLSSHNHPDPPNELVQVMEASTKHLGESRANIRVVTIHDNNTTNCWTHRNSLEHSSIQHPCFVLCKPVDRFGNVLKETRTDGSSQQGECTRNRYYLDCSVVRYVVKFKRVNLMWQVPGHVVVQHGVIGNEQHLSQVLLRHLSGPNHQHGQQLLMFRQVILVEPGKHEQGHVMIRFLAVFSSVLLSRPNNSTNVTAIHNTTTTTCDMSSRFQPKLLKSAPESE